MEEQFQRESPKQQFPKRPAKKIINILFPSETGASWERQSPSAAAIDHLLEIKRWNGAVLYSTAKYSVAGGQIQAHLPLFQDLLYVQVYHQLGLIGPWLYSGLLLHVSLIPLKVNEFLAEGLQAKLLDSGPIVVFSDAVHLDNAIIHALDHFDTDLV